MPEGLAKEVILHHYMVQRATFMVTLHLLYKQIWQCMEAIHRLL
jgi:hypothetical protein